MCGSGDKYITISRRLRGKDEIRCESVCEGNIFHGKRASMAEGEINLFTRGYHAEAFSSLLRRSREKKSRRFWFGWRFEREGEKICVLRGIIHCLSVQMDSGVNQSLSFFLSGSSFDSFYPFTASPIAKQHITRFLFSNPPIAVCRCIQLQRCVRE